MKVCVIVVTYNRLQLLKPCLYSLMNQTRQFDDIIVINNNSTDGTKEYLEGLEKIRVINQDNSGSAGGFNRGLKEAYNEQPDLIFLFDDDCEVYTNYLETALNYIEKSELDLSKPVAATSITYEEGRKLFFRGVSEGKWIKAARAEILYETEDLGFPFMIINRPLLETAGYPHTFWFTIMDDIEWADRIRKNGIKLFILNFEGGIHRVQRTIFKLFGRELENYAYWKTYYFYRNSIIYRRMKNKHLGIIRSIITLPILLLYPNNKFKRFSLGLKGILDGLNFKL
ncbi:glycosyltransferase [Desertivirga brevis]|uniref:glycosyltransferase n=1 Tax=Desertivirga brevis TaxID=2810310 RepID=UPI001A959C99|nr:glycosyltransferase [Pedobacter sp. SYSU D00873]